MWHDWGMRLALRFSLPVLALVAACVQTRERAPDPETLGATSSALTVGGLFPTGVNAAKAPLAVGAVDPHYVMTSTDVALPGPNDITVTPVLGWAPNTATSDWISAQASAMANVASTYTFTTSFPLSAVNPASAAITGKWYCASTCTVRLNGALVVTNVDPMAAATLNNFTIPAGSPFQLGNNTLDFQVTPGADAVVGLQVVDLAGTVNGCNADNQCAAGTQFCNTQAATCVARNANGAVIPTLTGHTPPLTGVCSAAVGTAVCTSAVCDTTDNKCGYANAGGPCSAADAPTVCRSSTCSVSGACEPIGGCLVDGDCAALNRWCAFPTMACTVKVANGMAISASANHVPVLNGTCTAAAGTTVCISGVCDAGDNLCGYANGTNGCNAANGATVCRSGNCSLDGTCIAAGVCNVDADCSAGKWCKISTHACTPSLANNTAMPTDPPHVNPALNGTCTAAAGTLVCTSGVCDVTGNACGLAEGHGPCTLADGVAKCRSNVCSANGTCRPTGGCNVDADCTVATPKCNASHTCQAPMPDGGLDEDAGQPDASTKDAGGPDAATPSADGGTPAPPVEPPPAATPSASSSDGGGCETTGNSPPLPTGAVLGVLGFAWMITRRRRSSSHRSDER